MSDEQPVVTFAPKPPKPSAGQRVQAAMWRAGVWLRELLKPVPQAVCAKCAAAAVALDAIRGEQLNVERSLARAQRQEAIIRRGLQGHWPEGVEEEWPTAALVKRALEAARAEVPVGTPCLGGGEEGLMSHTQEARRPLTYAEVVAFQGPKPPGQISAALREALRYGRHFVTAADQTIEMAHRRDGAPSPTNVVRGLPGVAGSRWTPAPNRNLVREERERQQRRERSVAKLFSDARVPLRKAAKPEAPYVGAGDGREGPSRPEVGSECPSCVPSS